MRTNLYFLLFKKLTLVCLRQLNFWEEAIQGSSMSLLRILFFFVLFSDWSVPFSIQCRNGLVVTNLFNLFLPWKVFISPLISTDTFTGYNGLGWQLWSTKTWSISFQALWALNISVENQVLFCLYNWLELSFSQLAIVSIQACWPAPEDLVGCTCQHARNSNLLRVLTMSSAMWLHSTCTTTPHKRQALLISWLSSSLLQLLSPEASLLLSLLPFPFSSPNKLSTWALPHSAMRLYRLSCASSCLLEVWGTLGPCNPVYPRQPHFFN